MIKRFNECSYDNKYLVGGKNASLGELTKLSQHLNIPIADGFAITTQVYQQFIKDNQLELVINHHLININVKDLSSLNETSEIIKNLFIQAKWKDELSHIVLKHYHQLITQPNQGVAVRSSAIDEDGSDTSFAGQQDTFLNVRGDNQLLLAIQKCFASLFNSHAISYRHRNGIPLINTKISVGVQKMVRSDLASAGVAFSLDTESGNKKIITINSSYGLGELVVSGGVKPDEYLVDKRVLLAGGDPILIKRLGKKDRKIVYDMKNNNSIVEIYTTNKQETTHSLTKTQIITLSSYVLQLEKEYSKLNKRDLAIDVEWALDGQDGKLYIVQVRPETVHSNKQVNIITRYHLEESAPTYLTGSAIGNKINNGIAKQIKSMRSIQNEFNPGDILVTSMTTPDWEPIMKIAGGVITDKGGRTCHAAIVAREIGVPCIVGTGNATKIISDKEPITINCSEGDTGYIYQGLLSYQKKTHTVKTNQPVPTQLMLNIASPENVFSHGLLPHKGVGLARLEFLMNSIKIHPSAIVDYPVLPLSIRQEIDKIVDNKTITLQDFFIDKLSRGIATIASAFYPEKVIVRLSDFKSNEYRNLIGGQLYEPQEENPMLGWRGASRYYSPEYKKAFGLECLALKKARETMKMDNIVVMIPFCRTPEECSLVLEVMKEYGLVRGEKGLLVYLMCEIPSNVIEADRFSPLIDGVSIGGNDLLQLTLGLDRDSEKISRLSDFHNISYQRLISKAISTYIKHGVKVGFCGQQPSDNLDFAQFLVKEGIDSISVTPDSILTLYEDLKNKSLL